MALSEREARVGMRSRDGRWTVRIATAPASIGGRWDEIVAHHGTTVFQDRDWLEEWYATKGGLKDAEPLLVIVDDSAGRCAMVLPLVLERWKGRRTIMFADGGVTDYNAPLLGPAAPRTPQAMRSLWRTIQRALPASDAIVLQKMPARIGRHVNPMTWLYGCGLSALTQSACDISAPYADARARMMPAAFRARLDSAYAKLTKRAAVTFGPAETSAEVDTIFAALLAQKRARAEMMGWDSLLDQPHWADFYRRMAHRGLAGGSARLLAMRVDGEIVAVILGFAQGHRFHDVIASFDATKWKRYSIGLVAADLSMAWMSAHGVTVYDLTIGAESYKDDYGPTIEPLHEYVAVRRPAALPGAMKAWAKQGLRARPRLKQLARRALGR